MRRSIITLFTLLMTLTAFAQGAPGPKVLFKTNMGDFTVMLYNETPQHRDNFLKIVREGGYNDLTFHRVIRNFMVQAGGGYKDDNESALEARQGRYPELVPAEFRYPELFHKRGALAAARVGDADNPEKKSDPIQFYIVVGQYYLESELREMETESHPMPDNVVEHYMLEGGTPHLDGEYTVFGELVDGWKTIEKIEKVQTDGADKPLKEVVIESATILQ